MPSKTRQVLNTFHQMRRGPLDRLLRHPQTTAVIEQVRVYAFLNGRAQNEGKPLQLQPIEPYPGFEHPKVFEIPESLKDNAGIPQSTTVNGTKPVGRLVLHTSRESMLHQHVRLRPRWKITYKANRNHIIGSKQMGELAPTVPGSVFIYGTVELAAFEPDYVTLGRVRPNDGPLVEAVDRFIVDCIKELAREISEHRKQELDSKTLDEVQRENRVLDRFKNQFLSSLGPGGDGANRGDGKGGPAKTPTDSPQPAYGDTPEVIEFKWDLAQPLRIGRGAMVRLSAVLGPRVVDAEGRAVPKVDLEWMSSERHIVEFTGADQAVARGKGQVDVWCQVRGGGIQSPRVTVDVWNVDHVLLTPRSLEIPLGVRQQITAQVTNDDGFRSTNVLLNWQHDAADPLIVRISPWGWITGNRIGRTSISAGAGNDSDGVWARIRAEVSVIPNPKEQEQGGGFPKLLVTDRDVDPMTGEIRQSNPDQPAVWQEVSDYLQNVWWLNLGSPDAALFFKMRSENPVQWRAFHAQKLVEMVVQVCMKEEFDAKGDNEKPALWNQHKNSLDTFQVMLMQSMWEKLKPFVSAGTPLE